MAVLLIVIDRDLKLLGLAAALARDGLRLRLLLRDDRLQLEFAELQVGAYAEERCRPPDERAVGRHTHVARFEQLDYLVLLALILQLDLLGVKVKRRVGVVVEVHVNLVADLSVDVDVDFLVEVKAPVLARRLALRGVVGVAVLHPELQLGTSLCLDLHAARAEYLFGRPKVKLHVHQVEVVLVTLKQFVVLVLVVGLHRAAERPVRILLGGHIERHAQGDGPHLGRHLVDVVLLVIHDLRHQPLWVFEVNGLRREVVERLRVGLAHRVARLHRVGLSLRHRHCRRTCLSPPRPRHDQQGHEQQTCQAQAQTSHRQCSLN